MRVCGVSTLCALGRIAGLVLLYAVSATGPVKAAFITASAHADWTGEAISMALADGSVLHEFSAHTVSGNRSGAVLAVSFVPRFECKPMISVRVLKAAGANITTETSVQFSIDDQIIEFETLGDDEDDAIRFSYHAGTAKSRTLRNLIDIGSRGAASLSSASSLEGTAEQSEGDLTTSAEADTGPVQSSAQSDIVNFSLLGSRKAIIAVEQACKDHNPVPYPSK